MEVRKKEFAFLSLLGLSDEDLSPWYFPYIDLWKKKMGKNSFFMLNKFCTPAPFFLCSFSWKYDFGVSTRKNRRSKAEHSSSPINLHQKEEENLLGKWIDLCCLFIVGGWRDFFMFLPFANHIVWEWIQSLLGVCPSILTLCATNANDVKKSPTNFPKSSNVALTEPLAEFHSFAPL